MKTKGSEFSLCEIDTNKQDTCTCTCTCKEYYCRMYIEIAGVTCTCMTVVI